MAEPDRLQLRAHADDHRQRHRAHRIAVAARHRASSRCSSSRARRSTWRSRRWAPCRRPPLRNMPPGTSAPFIITYNASSVPVLQLGLSGEGLSEQQLNDLGAELRPHAARHRAGRRAAQSVRRQAAADPGGPRPGRAQGQGTLAERRRQRDQPREPDPAGRHVEDRRAPNTTSPWTAARRPSRR